MTDESKPKPMMAKFEVPLPQAMSEEDFKASVTGTGPKPTRTGRPEEPDTCVDVDVDF